MDLWSEQLDKQFLTLPWSCYFAPDVPPLLLKLDFQTDPFKLTLLCTNLEEVYIETLNQRQLIRRVQDALSESTDTQTQSQSFTGVGEEGEKTLKTVVEEMMDAVMTNAAKVSLEHEAYQNDLIITLPTLKFSFLCNSLGSQSALCLKKQLLVPLLGCASSLLSIIPATSVEDGSLARALDASAKAESLQEGRVAKNFFGAGTSVFGRWTQRYNGVKEKHLQPVTLDPPRKRTLPSPFKSPTKSRGAPSPPPTSSNLVPPKPSFDFSRPSGNGERVGWEESQASLDVGKGKGSADSSDEEEKDLTPPPAAQVPSSPSKAKRIRDSPSPPSPTAIAEVEEEDPPTDDDEPAPLATGSGMMSPTPSPAIPIRTPSPTQEEMDSKARKKKEAAEKEAEEEKRIRKANAARIKKAQEAKAQGGVKKKVKRL